MKQIAVTTTAWLSRNDKTMRDLREATQERVTDGLSFHSTDMTSCGWTKVGTAEIIVTFIDENEINAAQVSSLREMKRAVMAKAEAEINLIEGHIQNLLCLEDA